LQKNQTVRNLLIQPKHNNMKKAIIGAIVGGLIIFIWQFVSFAFPDFHKSAHQYTEKQDAILSFLNNQGLKQGGYMLPSAPADAGMDEYNKVMQSGEGKPWVMIQYHNSLKTDMTMNMIRGFLVDVIAAFLLCWIIGKMAAPSFGTILTASLAAGLIAFLFGPYTASIWYEWPDTSVFLLDAVAAWGLTGLWLGWWLRRGRNQKMNVRTQEKQMEMA
jgi:hypothetical protein